MPGLVLWLVRHGETEINTGTWSSKPTDTCLTKQGKIQAQHCAQQMTVCPDLFIISPLKRAQETSYFFIKKCPNTPILTLPIQEFIYLSPKRLSVLSGESKKKAIEQYWANSDPTYCDGEDAESFFSFMQRVANFREYIIKLKGFIIIIGHGQFLKAFLLSLQDEFEVSPKSMRLFRKQQVAEPIGNCEIVKLELNQS